jgi:hypothetical protein
MSGHRVSHRICSSEDRQSLIVHGQGVFLFDAKDISKPCVFRILNTDDSDGLKFEFTVSSVKLERIATGESYADSSNTKGLTSKNGAYYWFSIDSQNQRFYAGIGEARIETGIYQYEFPRKDEKTPTNWENSKDFLESLVTIQVSSESTSLKPRKLLRDPIRRKVAMVIKDTEELTMSEIANGNFLPKATLPPVSQQLYECIAGNKFTLNDPDFPDFTRAIEFSIATPGKWCYERLKAKANEFSKTKPNPKETYLRITLGENNGDSPGIPYVMEIWPIGHYSPIHNHAGANAIIRVLNGTINVKVFPFLCNDSEGVEPFAKVDFKKDDITWISATLNQTHQLMNLETCKDTCITIQCYMYDDNNNTHYDYFDYIDADGKKQQYEPDSDMDFVEFKKIIQNEWLEQTKHQKKSESKRKFLSCW